MAHLIVGLTPTLARALLRGDRTTEATRLRDIAAKAHVDLAPQSPRSLDPLASDRGGADPDTADREATVWFSAETAMEGHSEDVDTQLLQIPGVTAAYVTPDQGPP